MTRSSVRAHRAQDSQSPVSGLEIDILRETGDWPAPAEGWVRRAAEHAYVVAGPSQGAELCIVLADDAFVRNLNRTYRGIDKPTNVLSFPMSAMPVAAGGEPMWAGEGQMLLLGDVVLAQETIAREAAEQAKSFGDHLSHLVVHGILHLLGHDHEEDAEAEEMEALERDILEDLGIADPYAAERARGDV
ncbi:MAG TPA: rRNA maturation RNase YbeY [Parvibaculum sp.]|uniref:rRNA maturation RNase YbeY n=1 Tax=Parvibaculum sp. TaxID=2024848 RepID=UPI002B847029|nr:rRNA maturation RNase YbeY [Parvibaculum sp.]HMM14048.1 rRNA maturation RNase YbeY [Parvibaculum sp.]